MLKNIQKMLIDGIDTWAPTPRLPVVDSSISSSPKIEKELHACRPLNIYYY
jgi:hypothetical protein